MLPAKVALVSMSYIRGGQNPPEPAAWAAPRVFPDTDECFFLHCFQPSFAVSSRSSRKTDALGAWGKGVLGESNFPAPKYPRQKYSRMALRKEKKKKNLIIPAFIIILSCLAAERCGECSGC